MSLDGSDMLARLMDTCPSPVIVTDLHGRILVFSRAAERMLGYRDEEARAHLHVTDLYHRPDEARRVMRQVRARTIGTVAGDDPLDITLRARNGELVPVRLTASLVRDQDGPVATLGIFVDRREQLDLGQRLEEATDQVVASERRAAGMTVAGAAAHEMAQPLTAAMGNLEMMLMEEEPVELLRDRASRAYEQLERLRRIVNDFARLAASRAAGPDEEG